MKKEKKLSRKEEIRVQKALMEMYHSGDQDLREEAIVRLWDMIEQFAWYAIKTWYPTYYAVEESREELLSCCKVAFLSEIWKFNPEQGTLSTFFTYPFKHEMHEWIHKEANDTTGYHAKMVQQVQNAIHELQSIGADISPSAISHICGLSVKKVNQTLDRIEMSHPQSLNAGEQFEEMVKGSSKSPEEMFLEAEASETIAHALKSLSEMDRLAVILYFGLDGSESKSYNAVAKIMKISAPQAQTCIARALHILRNNRSLNMMFGRGAVNYRQRQLDSIEISLITNENFIQAYNVLDDGIGADMNRQTSQASAKIPVLLSF